MRVYVDSSALIKRVIAEDESPALVDALDVHATAGDALVASSLAWIEVARAVQARTHPELVEPHVVDDAMAGIAEHPISREVVALARRVKPAVLRTLDAIHLASALLLDVDALIAYDRRLGEACAAHGFEVLLPGAGHLNRGGP
jgi:predicted nucleic acid-binding protein